MWGTRSSVAGTGSRSFDLPTRNRESPAPNEQEIKPTESISIFSVHFTLNLPQASRLLGMTKRRGLLKGKGPLPRDRAVVGRRGRLFHRQPPFPATATVFVRKQKSHRLSGRDDNSAAKSLWYFSW